MNIVFFVCLKLQYSIIMASTVVTVHFHINTLYCFVRVIDAEVIFATFTSMALVSHWFKLCKLLKRIFNEGHTSALKAFIVQMH